MSDRLYVINDRLTTLAQDLGVDIDDADLNELTHHVASVLDEAASEDDPDVRHFCIWLSTKDPSARFTVDSYAQDLADEIGYGEDAVWAFEVDEDGAWIGGEDDITEYAGIDD